MGTPNLRKINWSGVGFTPQAGTLIPILGVTSVSIDPRGKAIGGAGDADIYPTSKHMTEMDPQVTVEFQGVAALGSLTPGTRGTFVATANDADNEDGSGAISITITGCCIVNNPLNGRYRDFMSSTLTIETASADGRTSPISRSIAP